MPVPASCIAYAGVQPLVAQGYTCLTVPAPPPPSFCPLSPTPLNMHECHLGVLPAVLPHLWKPWLRFCVLQILDLDADALMQQVTQGCGSPCHQLVVHLQLWSADGDSGGG